LSLQTCNQGVEESVIGLDDQLTEEQLDLLQVVQVGAKIAITVNYQPDYQEEPIELKYNYVVSPATSAQFVGGGAAMND